MTLAEAFLPHAGEASARLGALPQLEQLLATRVQEARTAWPTVDLSSDEFLRHVAEKLATDAEPTAALSTLFTADLYLACACAHGVPAAIEQLEQQFMPRAAAHFVRNPSLARLRDELLQLLRTHLLVGEGGRRPRIVEYSGRAPFGAWFRVVVTRFAIDYARTHDLHEDHASDELSVAPQPDPELAYLKANHAADLDAAFRDTLSSLPARTANLLRLYYLEGVPAEAIAKLHDVSPRTVQRWIAAMRAKILRDTQLRLGEKLKISASQVGSLIAVIQSQMDLSICKFFEDDEQP